MNDFLKDTIIRAEAELTAAMQQHVEAYPDGDWKAANDRIGVARHITDAALAAAGLWPRGKAYLGNDAVIELLRSAKQSFN